MSQESKASNREKERLHEINQILGFSIPVLLLLLLSSVTFRVLNIFKKIEKRRQSPESSSSSSDVPNKQIIYRFAKKILIQYLRQAFVQNDKIFDRPNPLQNKNEGNRNASRISASRNMNSDESLASGSSLPSLI